jgi:putative membrane protein
MDPFFLWLRICRLHALDDHRQRPALTSDLVLAPLFAMYRAGCDTAGALSRAGAARINQPRGVAMAVAASIVIALIALLHLWFLVLEMFLWTKPAGRRAFGLTAEFAEQSKALAANQGLYNGFLAAGLVWGLSLGSNGFSVKLFFLGCVLVAGIFGGLTASRKILWIQALPAAIGLALILLA